MAHVLAELAGAVGTVTLDDERRRNALSAALVEEIVAALGLVPRGQGASGHPSRQARRQGLPRRARCRRAARDPPRPARLGRPAAPARARDRDLPWPGNRDGGGQRPGRGYRDRVRLRPIVVGAGATFAVTPAKLGVPYNAGGMPIFLNAAGLSIVKEMIFTARPLGRGPRRAAGPGRPRRAGGGAGGGRDGPGAGDRRQRAPERGGDEGGAADPGRRPPGDAAALRAGPRAAPGGPRQRRLPGGGSAPSRRRAGSCSRASDRSAAPSSLESPALRDGGSWPPAPHVQSANS